MKKLNYLGIFLILLIAGNSFGQYTPNSQLNYVKLLKTPPAGTKSDSVLVWNGTDKFVYMVPSSGLSNADLLSRFGTAPAKPMNGLFETGGVTKFISYNEDQESGIQFSGSGTRLFSNIAGINNYYNFGFNGVGLNFGVGNENKGIYSNVYHNKEGDSLAYAQMQDIEDAVSGLGTVTEVTGVTDEITVSNGTTTPVIGIATSFKNLFARLSGGNTFSGNQTINGTIVSQNAIFTKTDGHPIITGTNANDTDFIIGNTAAGATDKYVFIDSSIPNRALVLNAGSGGNVGIDTTTPQSKLDVNGSIRASSNDGTLTAVVRNEDLESGYVPLSGTESGNPITGDLEFNGAGYGVGFKQVFSGDAIKNTIEFNQDEGIVNKSIFYDNLIDLNIIKESLVSVNPPAFQVIESGIASNLTLTIDGVSLTVDNTDSKGIVGNTIFNKQDDPNAFAQLGDIPQANYKKYVALVSQSGTADPTVIVLENDFDTTITWKRVALGEYIVNGINDAGKSDKAFVLTGGCNGFIENLIYGAPVTSGIPLFRTSDPIGRITADGVLNKTSIEIRIYN